MGNPLTVRRLRELKKKINPDVMFLIESKNPDGFVLEKTEELGYDCHHLITPTGHGAGGLVLLWKQELNLQVISSASNVIDTCIVFEEKLFYASFIYGDRDRTNRKVLWNSLLNLANSRDAPWYITGDFNDLIHDSEKVGGLDRTKGSFSDLRTFFAEGDLYDLQHSGDPLSWRGQRGTHFVRCRLDRALANLAWSEIFPTASCHYMRYEGSDHRPLLSVFEKGKKRPRGLFRYDRRLKDNAEVRELVKQAWQAALK